MHLEEVFNMEPANRELKQRCASAMSQAGINSRKVLYLTGQQIFIEQLYDFILSDIASQDYSCRSKYVKGNLSPECVGYICSLSVAENSLCLKRFMKDSHNHRSKTYSSQRQNNYDCHSKNKRQALNIQKSWLFQFSPSFNLHISTKAREWRFKKKK